MRSGWCTGGGNMACSSSHRTIPVHPLPLRAMCSCHIPCSLRVLYARCSHRIPRPNRCLAALPSHLFAAGRYDWNMQVYRPCRSTASRRPPIISTTHTFEQSCLVSRAKHIRVECLILRRDSCLMAVRRSLLEHNVANFACVQHASLLHVGADCMPSVKVQVSGRGPLILAFAAL